MAGNMWLGVQQVILGSWRRDCRKVEWGNGLVAVQLAHVYRSCFYATRGMGCSRVCIRHVPMRNLSDTWMLGHGGEYSIRSRHA